MRKWVCKPDIGPEGNLITSCKWEYSTLANHQISSGWMLLTLAGDETVEVFDGDVIKNTVTGQTYLCMYLERRLMWLAVPILSDVTPTDRLGGPMADLFENSFAMKYYAVIGDVFANPKLAPRTYIEKWFPQSFESRNPL